MKLLNFSRPRSVLSQVPKCEAPGAPIFIGCSHFPRHLGHPSLLVVLTSPGTWGTHLYWLFSLPPAPGPPAHKFCCHPGRSEGSALALFQTSGQAVIRTEHQRTAEKRRELAVIRAEYGVSALIHESTGSTTFRFAGRSANRTPPITRNRITSAKFLCTP